MSDQPRVVDLSSLSRKNRVAANAELAQQGKDEPENVERKIALPPRPQRAAEIVAEAGDEHDTSGTGVRSADGVGSRPQPGPTFTPSVGFREPVQPAEQDNEIVRDRPASQAEADGLTPITMSARVTAGARNRAREAFRLTGYLEGDPSFGAFVELAMEREVQRRQDLYNNGQPFRNNPGRLPSGPTPRA
ncbi:hypothetical protein OVA26_16205 [Microbacterium sp. SL62]|uniref:ParB family protein n=1 Tax=Microbacterium sp. SL62 TaxID=2995139 RepID=UPI002274C816|nr:hypothetical protein [Microbacterium sp. SL62]MCY1718479.1 hypothetical protein [Microbacterium sp. SL62]